MNLLDSLNDQQQAAVTHDGGPLLIVAGAGTGKTTVITRRLAWLILEKQVRTDGILALTFTEKAAAEMEERLDTLLPYGYVDLWVSTFHAFGERLLRQHGLDIGLPADFQVLTQTQQWLLVRQNLERFDLDYYRPLGNPTKFIHELLKHFSRCKDEHVGPEDYLQYVEELRLNTDTAGAPMLTSPTPPPRGGGRSQSPQPPLVKGGAEVDATELKRLTEVANAYHVYQQLLLENSALDFGDLINYTLKLFQQRPNLLAQYRQQFQYLLVDEFQDTNYAQYELIKLLAAPANNITVVGDDDQSIYKFRGASISNILEFKADYPQSKEVFLNQNYRTRQNILDLAYQFIQLNNPNRLEVRLNELGNYPQAAPPIRGSGGPIRKRGQSIAIEPPNPPARGADHGTDQVSKVSFRVRIEPSVDGDRGDAAVHQGFTQDGKDGGVVKFTKKLAAVRPGSGLVEHLHSTTLHDEVYSVVKRIVDLKGADPEASWCDFAILVRANDAADDFVRALDSEGIPYQFLASRGLYGKPVVLDLIAYLKLLDNYHESPAVYRVLTMPLWSIPQLDIVELTHLAQRKAWSLYEAVKQHSGNIRLTEQTKTALQRLTAMVEAHSKLAAAGSVGKVILALLYDGKYLEQIKGLPPAQAQQWFSHLQQFYRKVQEFERGTEEPSVRNFLQAFQLEVEAGEAGTLQFDPNEGPETVKILTVHAAKGLEFRYVFIVNLVDRRFPTQERGDAIDLPDALVKEIVPEGDIHLQEERRLFYVAMTRAKDGVFFTSAEDYGGLRKKKPSRFLVELGVVDTTAPTSPRSPSTPSFARKGVEGELDAQAQELIQYALPKAFSFTQLKAFETCPLQYKFEHILRIPKAGRYQMSFGRTMHSALQQFFELVVARVGAREAQATLFGGKASKSPLLRSASGRSYEGQAESLSAPGNLTSPRPSSERRGLVEPLEKGGTATPCPVSEKELLALYEENWQDDWYESAAAKEEYRQKGERELKAFYATVKDKCPVPKYLEKKFSLKVGEHSIKGAIDRADQAAPGRLIVIDYKTGNAKTEDQVDKDQLYIYQLAVQEVLGEQVEALVYYYLSDGSEVRFVGSSEDLQKLKEKLAQTIEAIKTSDFHATPSIQKCRNCDFRDICEFRAV